MARTAATELQRKRTLTERLNEFLDMVASHGRSSGFRLGQFTKEEIAAFEATGRRAEEQRQFQDSVPKRVVRDDIRADALEASVDLAEGLQNKDLSLGIQVQNSKGVLDRGLTAHS